MRDIIAACISSLLMCSTSKKRFTHQGGTVITKMSYTYCQSHCIDQGPEIMEEKHSRALQQATVAPQVLIDPLVKISKSQTLQKCRKITLRGCR